MLLPIPAVSVCVAGSRSGRALGETVRSVLDQTFRDFELIVVGDASTDIARSFGDVRVRVERAPVGPGHDGRNLAVQIARASLVKVVRAHDLLHPRCLELQVAAMDSDPGLAMVASRWHMIDDRSRVVLPHRGLAGLIGMRPGGDVARRVVADHGDQMGPSTSVLFRHDMFASAGRWHNEHPSVIDLELWLRLLEHGDFLGLPEPLAAIRSFRTDPDAPKNDAAQQRRAFFDELAEKGIYPRRMADRLGAPARTVRRGGRALLGALAGAPGPVT